MKKHKKEKNSGITLIALVVTIIVLLILAGISIMMLSGNNGILNRAGEAKEKTEKSQIIEEVKLEILEAQIQKNGNSLYKSELKEILKKYFKDVDQTDIPNEITSSTNTELTTLNEKYTIKLSEIYSGKLATLSAGLYKAGTNEQISTWTDIVGMGKCVTVNDSGVLERNAFSIGDMKVKLVIDSSVKTIGNMAGIPQLEEVEIPDTVTSIGNNAFAGCTSLKNIEIPNSVISIVGAAFSGCSNLKSIYIPNGIKSFGGGLFYNCSSLTDVYYDGGKDEWVDISVEGGNEILSASTTTIHYLRQKYNEDYWDKLYVGATIVGYDPSIAQDGSIIETSYTSLGSYDSTSVGTYGDGTTGNGETNITFKTSSIKKWQILGLDETNKQILITSAGTPVAINGGVNNDKLMPFRGRSGYALYNDELNKVCAIYGQGKYADTTKYNVQMNTSTISTGGRSISIDDLKKIGYETYSVERVFTKNVSDGYIYIENEKTNSTQFNYWGEDVIPNEGLEWKKLESGQAIKMNVTYMPGTSPIYSTGSVSDEAKNMISVYEKDVNLQNWAYWISGNSLEWSMYDKCLRYLTTVCSGGSYPRDPLCSSNGECYGNGHGIRPAVYLKSNLKLSYNPTTQAFAIESE